MDELVEDVQNRIEHFVIENPPDLVIFDPFALPYLPLVSRLGVKCVALCDKALPVEDALVPPPCAAFVPRARLVSKVWVRLLWYLCRLTSLQTKLVDAILRALRMYATHDLSEACDRHARLPLRAYRVDRYIAYYPAFCHIDEWVLTSEEVELPRARPLPPNMRFVGPWPDLERSELPSPVKRAVDIPYFVYVAMGTAPPTWDSDLSILKKIVKALSPCPEVQLAVATGNEDASRALRARFPSVHIFAELPQLAMLRIADLAITHAGANTIRECIATSTPILAYPRGFDQPGNAARVAFHGLGLVGSRRFTSSRAIRRAALSILSDPSYGHRIRAIRERLIRTQAGRLEQALHAIGF